MYRLTSIRYLPIVYSAIHNSYGHGRDATLSRVTIVVDCRICTHFLSVFVDVDKFLLSILLDVDPVVDIQTFLVEMISDVFESHVPCTGLKTFLLLDQFITEAAPKVVVARGKLCYSSPYRVRSYARQKGASQTVVYHARGCRKHVRYCEASGNATFLIESAGCSHGASIRCGYRSACSTLQMCSRRVGCGVSCAFGGRTLSSSPYHIHRSDALLPRQLS